MSDIPTASATKGFVGTSVSNGPDFPSEASPAVIGRALPDSGTGRSLTTWTPRVLRLRDTPARIRNLLFISNPNDRNMKSPLGPILGTVLAAVLAAGLPAEAAGKSPDARLRTLPVNSIRAVREYFRYRGPSDMPIVSGHRGCREDGCPENSIRAFEHTLRRVPAFFEIDPRMTRDSVVVLMHDPTLDRTTTGHGPVSEHTWAELRELRLKDVHGNVTDERIPTLEEAIRWSAGKTVVNLDVYTPKEVLGPLLERLGFPPHVMLTIHTPRSRPNTTMRSAGRRCSRSTSRASSNWRHSRKPRSTGGT